MVRIIDSYVINLCLENCDDSAHGFSVDHVLALIRDVDGNSHCCQGGVWSVDVCGTTVESAYR